MSAVPLTQLSSAQVQTCTKLICIASHSQTQVLVEVRQVVLSLDLSASTGSLIRVDINCSEGFIHFVKHCEVRFTH